MRAIEQPTLFGGFEPEGTGARSEPDAPMPGGLESSAAASRGGDGTELPPAQGVTSHAVSPLAKMALREVCAYCGKEIQLPGFVILDFEDLGAFCNEVCGDRRFRLFLDEGPD